MNKHATKPPPPGFAEYVNSIVDLRIELSGVRSRLALWGQYGPAAHPFVIRELQSLRRLIDRIIESSGDTE